MSNPAAHRVRYALVNPAVMPHSAQNLAAALNLSPRSLPRQLREEGVSLQQLKDGVHSEKARDLLLRTKKLLKQAAVATGFKNDKSFSRAFQGWTGVPPGVFRAGNEDQSFGNLKRPLQNS